ncbi:MAG: hypothetical protein ABIO05_07250 [Ferruginibacter sp.]
MSDKKKFGIWMDNYSAVIVGKDQPDDINFKVVGEVNSQGAPDNSSEKNLHNHETALRTKFFKEITTHMQNAEQVHVTGTGQAQEQFIHFLADTPQFKNTKTSECTSNKMSNERLVEFLTEKLN